MKRAFCICLVMMCGFLFAQNITVSKYYYDNFNYSNGKISASYDFSKNIKSDEVQCTVRLDMTFNSRTAKPVYKFYDNLNIEFFSGLIDAINYLDDIVSDKSKYESLLENYVSVSLDDFRMSFYYEDGSYSLYKNTGTFICDAEHLSELSDAFGLVMKNYYEHLEDFNRSNLTFR